MNITHWMRNANSGLCRTTLEIAHAEQALGHAVTVKQPTDGEVLYGDDAAPDVHCVHSQLPVQHMFDSVPKILWAHAEPLHSIANGASMSAILDLAPKADAMICMRREEQAIWSSFLRTHLVPKGIDLDVFKPAEPAEKLPGSPAVLYYENWRGERNPLYWLSAMEQVYQQLPEAKLHLFNCPDRATAELFASMINHCKWAPFVGNTLHSAEEDVPALIARADIVVSSVYPLYARSIEAFGCGKPLVCPGYREDSYAFRCELEPSSMAQALLGAWETRGHARDGVAWCRAWAEQHHDVRETARQAVEVYQRYV